jgi:hypothetical protein
VISITKVVLLQRLLEERGQQHLHRHPAKHLHTGGGLVVGTEG